MPQEISGALDAGGRSFAIVISRFNEFFTRRLMEGAVDALLRHGAEEESLTIVWVPGTFEVPQVVHGLAASGRFDAVIGLGLVIKGETSHHELVAAEAVSGVAAAARATGIPCPLGIVTAENLEQAAERCGSKQGNRGWDAAMAAMEMVNVLGWVRTLGSETNDDESPAPRAPRAAPRAERKNGATTTAPRKRRR